MGENHIYIFPIICYNKENDCERMISFEQYGTGT